jgi:hypothetical protein
MPSTGHPWQSAGMRVFTILGVVFTIIGAGLVIVAFMPSSGGIDGEATTMGAGIAALTLLPMGIVFTVIGVATSRSANARRRLLETGVPGQATILSVSGGNVVVNRINVLLTFRLRVVVPGRPAYDTDHRQLTSMFQMGLIQVGTTVPVMVDPMDPKRLTLDLAGEGAAAAARAARPVTNASWSAPVQPNTLSTMGGAPNTISADPSADAGWPVASTPLMPAAGTFSVDPAALVALNQLLARAGISIDPDVMNGARVSTDASVVDLRSGGGDGRSSGQEHALADGLPGTAVIRAMSDTGVNVQGDSLVRLTLDVLPEGGTSYPVQTGSLVPDEARARAFPGATVRVRIDAAQPASVVVDWSTPA